MRSDPRAPGLVVGDRVLIGEDVQLGAHVVIHEGVHIGPSCRIGSHVVIREGTIVGAACLIEDHVVLGKQPRLAKHSSAAGGGALPPLQLQDRVTVCSGAVLFAGAKIDAEAIVGDQSYVRERSHLGAGSVLGRGSVLDNDVLVGARVRIQTGVYITAFSTVEDDVFIGPSVVTTNDDTMARHPPKAPLQGATLRRACRIGGGAVLTPGVTVGEEAFLGAGAVLTKDLPPRAVAIGVPARVIREVQDGDLLQQWR